ncbi:hypothetical protein K469DRAFT_127624 [Zopfia rhizophila CBS 207.26]|uniref:Uncharacterized protein n=1 Tax=Zopfia rhizophila CBS 207.26 TaxID=1314779 RepID=A0A6A6ESB0_9PEZI|nr:hypothetical protein K469DRAFT_127624 [Zopfia rhizophila CBS 207.26]
MMKLRGLWILVLSLAVRQLAAQLFTYYMPGYLKGVYLDVKNLRDKYGIIVGVAGPDSVVFGGAITCVLWR